MVSEHRVARVPFGTGHPVFFAYDSCGPRQFVNALSESLCRLSRN